VLALDTTSDGTGTYSLDDDTGDLIWVSIRCGSPILEVTHALLCNVARNPNGGAAICDAPGELVNASCLVSASHALIVALSIDLDVLQMAGLKFLHGFFNVFDAVGFAHLLGRYVGV
jgi:hypothetical protein